MLHLSFDYDNVDIAALAFLTVDEDTIKLSIRQKRRQ